MKELCDVVTDTLDSMLCAILPREYFVKYLIEKELPFYSTKLMPFEKTIPRERAMLMPPDPSHNKFDDLFIPLFVRLVFIPRTRLLQGDAINLQKELLAAH